MMLLCLSLNNGASMPMDQSGSTWRRVWH